MSTETKLPWGATLLRAFAHGTAAATFVWTLESRSAAFAATGAFLGFVCGAFLERRRWRPRALFGGAALILALSFVARAVVLGSPMASELLGPTDALVFGTSLFFGGAACALSFALGAFGRRWPTLAFVELGLAASAVAQLVIAHRHGAINRPFEIADPILAAGGDPTQLFLLVGAAGLGILVVLLLREERVWRNLLHLGVLALILLGIAAFTPVLEPPGPPPGGMGLGLRPDENEPSEEEEEQADGQGSDGSNPNDSMEFRDRPENQRNTPVGVVLFHRDYQPPNGTYYFRQSSFSFFNGQRLVAAPDQNRDIARSFPSAPIELDLPDVTGQHRREVETTVALLADHTLPFGLESPVRVAPAPNIDPARFKRIYRVRSNAFAAGPRELLGANLGDPAWGPEEQAHFTQGPDDPRYAALAEEILATLPPELANEPAARVYAITQWLGEQGTYSLNNNHSGASDPTADFLFGDLTGYCVHFAHAAVFLFRAAGIPARVATGYAIEESSRQGGSALLVSSNTSHAWPEVRFAGLGWIVTDVAPQTVLSPPPPPPDADLQRLLGELARGLEDLPPEPDDPIPAAARSLRNFLTFGLWSLLSALVFALLTLGVIKLWRALRPRMLTGRTLPRDAYRAALDRLSELGIRRDPGEAPGAFAARLSDVPSFALLSRAHLALSFGSGKTPTPDETRRALRAFGRELASLHPWWKRIGAALLPWTWLRSR